MFQNQSNKVHRVGILIPIVRNWGDRVAYAGLDWHRRVNGEIKSRRAREIMVANENLAAYVARHRITGAAAKAASLMG